jgi:hypothetical protein
MSSSERMQFWAAVATMLSLLVAVLGLVWTVWRDLKDVERAVQRVERRAEQVQLRVTYPYPGQPVGAAEIARGVTPYRDRNHAVVVTPVETGDNWVQEGPVTLDTTGAWMGHARFGTGLAGPGQNFLVRVVATRDVLPAGRMSVPPQDAQWSEGVVVRREEQR